MQNGTNTRQEILSQPVVWEAALAVIAEHKEEILHSHQPQSRPHVFFTGCGSTYYLALAAAALFTQLGGKPARALPASELWLNPASFYPTDSQGRNFLVAVSRSGETSETLRACEDFLASGRGELLTLTCNPGSSLAKMGTFNLLFPMAAEVSVAQTRAFSTLYLATVALCALWSGQEDVYRALPRLPEIGQRLLDRNRGLAQQIGSDLELERFYFLGSGARFGLACELSLKMKEMTLSHSEPFHFLEFRHGPMSMVTPQTLIMGLVSDQCAARETAVMAEMKTRGAHLLELGENGADIPFHSALPETARNILYLPVGQMIALQRSLAKGLNPDRPNNLTAFVQLDDFV